MGSNFYAIPLSEAYKDSVVYLEGSTELFSIWVRLLLDLSITPSKFSKNCPFQALHLQLCNIWSAFTVGKVEGAIFSNFLFSVNYFILVNHMILFILV